MNKNELLDELEAINDPYSGRPLLKGSGKFTIPLALLLCWLPILIFDDLTISQQFLVFMALLIPMSWAVTKVTRWIDNLLIKNKLKQWS